MKDTKELLLIRECHEYKMHLPWSARNDSSVTKNIDQHFNCCQSMRFMPVMNCFCDFVVHLYYKLHEYNRDSFGKMHGIKSKTKQHRRVSINSRYITINYLFQSKKLKFPWTLKEFTNTKDMPGYMPFSKWAIKHYKNKLSSSRNCLSPTFPFFFFFFNKRKQDFLLMRWKESKKVQRNRAS